MTIRSDVTESITTKAFKPELRLDVKDLGGVLSAARVWDVPYQRISNTINSDVLPAQGILEAMGYESVKTINYRYKEVK